MWHILAYMSHVPDTRTWTAILLFMCIFVLLNIFVSFCYSLFSFSISPKLSLFHVSIFLYLDFRRDGFGDPVQSRLYGFVNVKRSNINLLSVSSHFEYIGSV